ncbi:MAG: hypothetical protein ACRDYZ_04990 [Acidimicrobiales bacterium]
MLERGDVDGHRRIIRSVAVGGHTAVFWDIALRDFGLMIAVLAIAPLAAKFAPRRLVGTRRS